MLPLFHIIGVWAQLQPHSMCRHYYMSLGFWIINFAIINCSCVIVITDVFGSDWVTVGNFWKRVSLGIICFPKDYLFWIYFEEIEHKLKAYTVWFLYPHNVHVRTCWTIVNYNYPCNINIARGLFAGQCEVETGSFSSTKYDEGKSRLLSQLGFYWGSTELSSLHVCPAAEFRLWQCDR